MSLPRADFQVLMESGLVLWWPISPAACAWRDDHLSDDAQTWGAAVVIESRYWPAIAEGLAEDGLVGRRYAGVA